jgi:hypothetical protein
VLEAGLSFATVWEDSTVSSGSTYELEVGGKWYTYAPSVEPFSS